MIYKCNNCGHELKNYFGICPSCKDGFGVETKEVFSSSTSLSKNFVLDIKKVDPNVENLKAFKKTNYKNFNSILSSANGFIKGQVILLGASPGVGKSTLCTSISDEDTLYISSEENYSQVNSRALRVNPKCGCSILNSTNIEEILEGIRISNKKLIIIDSLNSIEFGVGYLTTAKFANKITQLIKELNKVCIIISQVTRSGEITGMNSIIHIVDTVLHLERSEISSNIIAATSKNRYGEIGSVAVFRHESDGFKEINVDHIDIENEIGATYTETRFGHKNMTIAIESLVADAQSSFGLRKSNGYNQNRLIQVIGILSYFSKINLSSKDIYVAISNGLSTDDISIELAMANSILSSYYKKFIIRQAYGEIRLNGKISNGTIDGKEIKHINELIQKYRK